MKRVLMSLLIGTVFLGLLVSGVSCSKSPESTVKGFMDAIVKVPPGDIDKLMDLEDKYLDEDAAYALKLELIPLSLCEVRDYDIKNVSGSVVSVYVAATWEGIPMSMILTFTVENGKIVDIREELL
jgi:hypothetical protein